MDKLQFIRPIDSIRRSDKLEFISQITAKSPYGNPGMLTRGKQLYSLLIEVNSDLGHIFHTVDIALAAPVDKGLVQQS